METLSGGTLLVVDDEVEIREIIELYASTLGMKVLEAEDGDRALEILRAHHVDVIVSDLMMPRLTGLGLLEALRKEGFMQPFIFVTAYPSQDSTIQALRLGAFDYLEKPFDPEELGTLLTEALRVSLETQKLSPEKKKPQGSDETKALYEINRLKTLRFDNAGQQPERDPKQKLLDHFVNEATPQLLFAEASIKNLMNESERAFELGYLFRVMQGIAAAADAVGERDVKRLSGAAERFYTVLRVKPRAMRGEFVELARRANEKLRELVASAGSPAPTSEEGGLDELVLALENGAQEIERYSMFAAS